MSSKALAETHFQSISVSRKLIALLDVFAVSNIMLINVFSALLKHLSLHAINKRKYHLKHQAGQRLGVPLG